MLALPRDVIDERFGLAPHEGLDIEIVGCTRGIPGGGFLYTNRDTVSIGVVVSVTGLAAKGRRNRESPPAVGAVLQPQRKSNPSSEYCAFPLSFAERKPAGF